MKYRFLKYLVHSREWANTSKGENIVVRTLTVLAIVMLSCFVTVAFGQEIVQNGQQFEKVSKKKSEKSDSKDTITSFTYKDKTGVYPVWLSKTGKAFIWKTNKKTGEKYRKYIPEVGRKINPGAYENETNVHTKEYGLCRIN